MKRQIIFIYFSIIFSVSYSQTSFLKLLYDNNALGCHDASRPICRTHDSNYVVTSYGFINYDLYYLVFKVDCNGNVLWAKKIGDVHGEPSDIQLDFDNGFIITGHSHIFGGNSGYGDLLIVKLDSNGVFQWARNIRSARGSEGTMLTKTLDSCYIITGGAQMSFPEQLSEIPIIKIDNYGNVLWSKVVGKRQSDEKAYAIKNLHDSCFIIAGITIRYDSLLYPISNDALIFKINQDGVLLWSKTYPNSKAKDIIETKDHGFAFTGVTYDDSVSRNILFVKLDSIGNLEFSKSIGDTTFDEDGISLQQNDNNLFLIAGSNFDNNNSTSHIFMLELNQNGDKIWSNNYFYYSTMFGYYGPSFVVDAENIFMGGIKNDNAPVNSFPYIFKLDTSGYSCINSSYSPVVNPRTTQLISVDLEESFGDTLYEAIIGYTQLNIIENMLCMTTNYTEILKNYAYINIYPNPATDKLYIKLTEKESVKMHIYNTLGMLILQKDLPVGMNTIDIGFLPKGVYVINFSGVHGTETKKVVKQ